MSRGFRRPPSLIRGNGYYWALGIIVITATFLRFWRLSSLPGGLAPGEAVLALAGQGLARHGVWPDLSAASGQAPLIVILLALTQMVAGLSPWVLRILPALSGVAAVIFTYGWTKDVFDRRTGLIAAALLATSPWAITLNRSISAAAFVPGMLALLLWLGLRLIRNRRPATLVTFVITSGLIALTGPAGWAVVGVVGVGAMVWFASRTERPVKLSLVVLVGVIVVLIPSLIALTRHHPSLGLVHSFPSLIQGVGATLTAFLFHGDDNYQVNLGGQPLLNIFIAIMLVAGILVTATRSKRTAYRVLGVMGLVSLMPTMLTMSDSPSASRLGLALIPAMITAAIGTGYMLETWYTTFPINSAARLTGQAAIITLLVLSAVQGYNQYFIAWAGSSATHGAYSERALSIADWADHQPGDQMLTLVVDQADIAPLSYGLLTGHHPTQLITSSSDLDAALKQRPLTMALAAPYRDTIIPKLKLLAAGGTLVPHRSDYDQSELFYSYAIH